MGFAICGIWCWDCGHRIDDYDPAIDQYTCKACREKAAQRNAKRDRMRPPRKTTIGPDDNVLEFDF